MKWRIAGADRATGADRTIEVEADDEWQAKMRAKERNILVEKLEMTTPAYQSQPSPNLIEVSKIISSRATGLSATAIFFAAVGWIAALVMFVGFGGGIALMLQGERPELVSPAITAGLSAFFSTIACFAVSGVLRMLAAIGLGVRELMAK
jgi:hypothetical protein